MVVATDVQDIFVVYRSLSKMNTRVSHVRIYLIVGINPDTSQIRVIPSDLAEIRNRLILNVL
jgi:hypothetical protein